MNKTGTFALRKLLAAINILYAKQSALGKAMSKERGMHKIKPTYVDNCFCNRI